ncbi:MAG: hypothetical protein ACXAE3_10670 [Candidatus Kariarchaeaceae archaeon]|jgi:hypothetical protein
MTPDKFPTVTADSLNRTTYTIPQDLKGDYNIVVVAFLRWHQDDVDTWVPFLEQLEKEQGIHYYELPTIRRGTFMSRFMLDSAMRGGIPDKTVRERTITLYLDVAEFCGHLGIGTSSIWTYLLDKEGNILHTVEGRYSEEKAEVLQGILLSRI